MELSEKVAERVVYYFRNYYGIGKENIFVNPQNPKRVEYRDFGFIININEGNKALDVRLIPPEHAEQYIFHEADRKKTHKHRKRIQGGKFDHYHYRARLSPIKDKLMYLDQLTTGVIDCVIRPVMLCERDRCGK